MSNPGLVLILGAVLVPLLRGWLRAAWLVLVPVAGLALLWRLPAGTTGGIELFGLALAPLRVDPLSRVFATAFLAAALICLVYGLHLRGPGQPVTTLVYAGSAVGAVLAGDLLTLFVFWELSGIASVFLIWARGTGRSYQAGMRYLTVQVISGLLLLAGIALRVSDGHGLEFVRLGLDGPGEVLILLAIGIKAGFPVLHAWLPDTYPEATVVGAVVLSAFTTKLGIYALARGYPGTELLVWVGAVMTVFPIFYAVIENDLRRVLAYSMINQLGFMVVGVGIGGALGVNGAAAHAVADILFKALLFMSMGAVLLRTGTVKGSELGGLYKSMPQTTILCLVGAASISAFPLFSGFATKSMIMEAVGREHRLVVWLVLLFASAGVFHHAGIKIPFFAFFAHDRGWRVAEAPVSMRVAMALAAAGSITIGVAPGWLYRILPYPVDYVPYTVPHVVNQLQLLLLASMAFTVLIRTGLYPPELRSVNLDLEVVYRRLLPGWWGAAVGTAARLRGGFEPPLRRWAAAGVALATRAVRPGGRLALAWSTDAMVWWVTVLLGLLILMALL
jgi:multicomponent Na+:H+ antiporter subunit D